MKENCQIRTAEELAHEYERAEKKNIRSRIANEKITDDGDLVYELWHTPRSYHEYVAVPAGSLAYFISMPNWEVVKVDKDGDQVNALLFFEGS